MQQKLPNLHFILLGEGYDRSALEQQAKGLHNVTFQGMLIMWVILFVFLTILFSLP